jgi:CrcB protein
LNAQARIYVAVGIGAAIGSLLRFGVYALVAADSGPLFAGTIAVNIVGSFVIGAFATLTGPNGRAPVSVARRNFVMGGICGGFTTFSSMSLDTFVMLDAGRPACAALYLAGSVAASLAATWLGWSLAARLNR